MARILDDKTGKIYSTGSVRNPLKHTPYNTVTAKATNKKPVHTFAGSNEPSPNSRLGQGKGDVKKNNTGRSSQIKNRSKK